MNGTLRPESFRGAKPAEDNISIPLARLLEPPRQIDAITNRGGRIFVSRAGSTLQTMRREYAVEG
jgi:hypothetical protein